MGEGRAGVRGVGEPGEGGFKKKVASNAQVSGRMELGKGPDETPLLMGGALISASPGAGAAEAGDAAQGDVGGKVGGQAEAIF